MPTQDTIGSIYKAFQENPIRITYSISRLQKQFNSSQEQVQWAKDLYRICPTNYALALSLLNADMTNTPYEEEIDTTPSSSIPSTSDEWEVKQKWVKGPEGSQLMVKKESTDYKKEFLDFVNKYQFESVVASHPYKNNPKLAVVCLFDIHLGKIAHFKYTRNTDNLREQEESYRVEFGKLLSFIKSQSIFEIILPIGNDLLNVDNVDLGTSKRTPQSNTSDLHGMFELGLNLMTETINSLAQLGCKVNVVLVPGNHATMSETYLALALDQVYKNDVRVDINHSPNPRKYYQWGKVCLGFAHGELPLKKYAELFPHEAKEFFSSSNHFEMLVGDKHIEEVHKNGIHDDGVIVRRLAALTKNDSWHHQSGYTLSKRRSYVLIYDKENGLEIQYTNSASKL